MAIRMPRAWAFSAAPERLDAVLELVLGRSLAREDADGGVGRTAEDLTTERLAALHDAIEVGDGGVPDLRIGRDRIGFRAHHRDGRRAQAEALQPLAQPLERREIGRVEDRDLDGVEAEDLDLVEDRVLLLGDVGGPQEQVHAGFHGRCPSGQNTSDTRMPLRSIPSHNPMAAPATSSISMDKFIRCRTILFIDRSPVSIIVDAAASAPFA